MSDDNQNNSDDGGEESPDPQSESFLSRHGCLIVIVLVLLVGSAAGLYGFVSWLERGN